MPWMDIWRFMLLTGYLTSVHVLDVISDVGPCSWWNIWCHSILLMVYLTLVPVLDVISDVGACSWWNIWRQFLFLMGNLTWSMLLMGNLTSVQALYYIAYSSSCTIWGVKISIWVSPLACTHFINLQKYEKRGGVGHIHICLPLVAYQC